MNTASRSPHASPARASRASNSRSEKPQSISRRLVLAPLRASTIVALPPLPLPRLQKRIARPVRRRLLQVFEQHRRDALAGFAVLGCSLAVEHRHRAALAFALHDDAVARRAAGFVLLAEAE